MKQTDNFFRLYHSIQSLNNVYESTIYGARHKEAFILRLMSKFLPKGKLLPISKDLYTALMELDAIDKVKNVKKIPVNFTNKEKSIIIKISKSQLKIQREVPILARQQSLISLVSIFESFITDTLKTLFYYNLNSLKSENTTLNDREIIEAVSNKNVIDAIIESKTRKLLYEPFEKLINYLNNNFGLDIEFSEGVSNIILLRNCIVHNNCKVSKELSSELKIDAGKSINITKGDYKLFLSKIFEYSKLITIKVTKKYENKTLPENFCKLQFIKI